jgi:hypothetical protein
VLGGGLRVVPDLAQVTPSGRLGTDEVAHRELLREHAERGDLAAAARQFRLLREELARLGLRPAPETTALHDALCSGPAVQAPPVHEGPLIGRDDDLHPIQAAFVEHDALQCGFCTPGQILAAASLLRENPAPTDGEIVRGMSGNLCRCGAYPKIVRAVQAAAQSANGESADG